MIYDQASTKFLFAIIKSACYHSTGKVGDVMTIQEACQRLGKSESTVRRMIRDGRLTSSKKDGIYDIAENSINDQRLVVNDQLNDQRLVVNDQLNDQRLVVNDQLSNELVKQLQDENRYLKERIEELESSRERADMISIQLTRQLEQSQRMLEARKEPFWRRWF
jgi:hypothetical protein